MVTSRRDHRALHVSLSRWYRGTYLGTYADALDRSRLRQRVFRRKLRRQVTSLLRRWRERTRSDTIQARLRRRHRFYKVDAFDSLAKSSIKASRDSERRAELEAQLRTEQGGAEPIALVPGGPELFQAGVALESL